MAAFFHPRVDARILAYVGGSMDVLVGPSPNRGIAAAMPSLVEVLDKQVAAGPMRECLHAGLWLLGDDLDAAHRICQDVETAHGAAWHAVVHRREGDFWNSKYWWRRAGGVRFEGLAEGIRAALPDGPAEVLACVRGGRYDGSSFVDIVERSHGDVTMREALVTVQRMEWVALFGECWR